MAKKIYLYTDIQNDLPSTTLIMTEISFSGMNNDSTDEFLRF
jgi:hypothetical protein